MRALVMTPFAFGVLMFATASTADCQRHERPIDASQARMQRTIDAAIHGDGPFFTPAEQEVIRRACAYGPEWDGSGLNVANGALVCEGGRRVDSPEVRAVLDAAAPRIARRVQTAMASPAVRAAIDAYAQDVTERALERVDGIPRRRPEPF